MRFRNYYFCSKFLISVDNKWKFVPDPLKLISKLGRKDLANRSHMLEYYTAFKDLTQVYHDARINTSLNDVI